MITKDMKNKPANSKKEAKDLLKKADKFDKEKLDLKALLDLKKNVESAYAKSTQSLESIDKSTLSAIKVLDKEAYKKIEKNFPKRWMKFISIKFGEKWNKIKSSRSLVKYEALIGFIDQGILTKAQEIHKQAAEDLKASMPTSKVMKFAYMFGARSKILFKGIHEGIVKGPIGSLLSKKISGVIGYVDNSIRTILGPFFAEFYDLSKEVIKSVATMFNNKTKEKAFKGISEEDTEIAHYAYIRSDQFIGNNKQETKHLYFVAKSYYKFMDVSLVGFKRINRGLKKLEIFLRMRPLLQWLQEKKAMVVESIKAGLKIFAAFTKWISKIIFGIIVKTITSILTNPYSLVGLAAIYFGYKIFKDMSETWIKSGIGQYLTADGILSVLGNAACKALSMFTLGIIKPDTIKEEFKSAYNIIKNGLESLAEGWTFLKEQAAEPTRLLSEAFDIIRENFTFKKALDGLKRILGFGDNKGESDHEEAGKMFGKLSDKLVAATVATGTGVTNVGKTLGEKAIEKVAVAYEAGSKMYGKLSGDLKGRYQKAKEYIFGASKATGVDSEVMVQMAGIESQYKQNVVHPGSKATGLFQIVPDTWRGLLRSYGRELKKHGIDSSTPMDDPRANSIMGAFLLAENSKVIKGMGQPLTPSNFYLAHNLGGPDYQKFIRGERNTPNGYPAEAGLSRAVKSNPLIYTNKGRELTFAQVRQNVINLMSAFSVSNLELANKVVNKSSEEVKKEEGERAKILQKQREEKIKEAVKEINNVEQHQYGNVMMKFNEYIIQNKKSAMPSYDVGIIS